MYPGVWSIPLYAFHSGILHTFQDNVERIARVSNAQRSYLCTLPTRELVDVSQVLRAAGYHIHYDIMDDWEAFLRGDEEMTHWFSASVELEMVALADTVTAVSDKLGREVSSACGRILRWCAMDISRRHWSVSSSRLRGRRSSVLKWWDISAT